MTIYCANEKCDNYGEATELVEICQSEDGLTPADYGTYCCGTPHWTGERNASQRERHLENNCVESVQTMTLESVGGFVREMNKGLLEFNRHQQLEMAHGEPS